MPQLRSLHPLLLVALAGACGSSLPASPGDGGGGRDGDVGDAGDGVAPDQEGACPAGVAPGPGVVVTDRGAVAGVADGRTWAYLAVPFAAPPLADLRWRAPQPHACWPDAREAKTWGPLCPQLDDNGSPVGEEDCLQLNLWVPEPRPTTPAPVLFWIHGGGHVQGGAAKQAANGTRIYDGRALAEKTGAVVVTINYRLGALGYLAHAALSAEAAPRSSGGYGTLDQIAALDWVQHNAAAFGGDPRRVMIFGESAGGVAVCTLLASPLAKGRFGAAIIQSGGCNAQPLATGEAFGVKVFAAAHCDTASDPVACMRGLTATAVVTALPVKIDVAGKPSEYGSLVDGWILAGVQRDVIAAGGGNHVPVIVGSNSDETSTSVSKTIDSDAAYLAALAALFPTAGVADKVAAEYPSSAFASPRAAMVAVTTDLKFVCPSRGYARAFAKGQSEPVYRYVLTHALDNSPSLKPLGAWHGIDVSYIFGNLAAVSAYVPSAGELDLADAFAGYWGRFAASGNPNGGAVEWPRYDASDPYLRFEVPITSEKGYRTGHCDFWDKLGGG